jgi:hypothetical protein
MREAHTLVDGSIVVLDAPNDLTGLATSRAFFQVGKRRQMVENAPIDYAEAMRHASRVRDDLSVIEEVSSPHGAGTMRAATVRRRSSISISSEPSVFTMAVWEGRTGSLVFGHFGPGFDETFAILADLDIREDDTGVWIGNPIDLSLRPPFFLKQLPGCGLAISQPMTPSLSRNLPPEPGRAARGGTVYAGSTGTGPSAILTTSRSYTEIVPVRPDDRPERIALDLVVSWS